MKLLQLLIFILTIICHNATEIVQYRTDIYISTILYNATEIVQYRTANVYNGF